MLFPGNRSSFARNALLPAEPTPVPHARKAGIDGPGRIRSRRPAAMQINAARYFHATDRCSGAEAENNGERSRYQLPPPKRKFTPPRTMSLLSDTLLLGTTP